MGLGLVDKPHLRRFKRKLDEQLNNLFVKKTDKGTDTTFGVVRVDGITITSNDGVISGVASSSGHTIVDASGTAMEQEDNLQFVGVSSVTDETDTTVVTVLPFTITVNPNGGYDVTYPS